MSSEPTINPSISAVAERILSEQWEGTVRLGRAETLSADKGFRFEVASAPEGAPASVIIKKPREEPGIPTNPDATYGNPSQPFLEEWAGLMFLNSLLPDSTLVPAYYGGDRTVCVVVFEDLGQHTNLVDILRGTNPERARECLALQAQAFADLHTHTAGYEAYYWQIRDTLGPRGVPRAWKTYGNLLDTQGWGDLRALQPELQSSFDRIGQQVGSAFWDEYVALVAAIERLSPFRTYVQNDACPDNTIFTPNGPRLIDFERGGYHVCLLDAVYCRLSMPHCYWANRLPDDVTPMVERAYRERLSRSIPAVNDDRAFGNAITEACAYWIISNGMWMVHRDFEQDFNWGSATWRQRVVLRLEQFAATTEEFTHLVAMGAAARETIRRLKHYWTVDPMPLFPAFH